MGDQSNPILVEHVQARLKVIQERHNFNPNIGAAQIRGRPDLRIPYAEFRELRKLIDKTGLDVTIPHDPAGLTPLAHAVERSERQTYVYFAQKQTTNIWKIGYSYDPPGRVKQLSTGNDGVLRVRHQVPGGYEEEQALLSYLRHFKTRQPNEGGEWVSGVNIRQLVRRLREEGFTFVYGPPLRPTE